MTVAIDCRGLWAGHDGTPVVRDLSLTVAEGEIVALLGANGAGKTTTLRTIAGLLPAIRGELTVLGKDVPAHKPHILARRGLAFVPDDRGLFFSLTGLENLNVAQRSRRADPAAVLVHFPALADRLGRRAGLLSGGEQQMLAVGRALLSRPKVLLIDELSLGLAPVIVGVLMPTLRQLAREYGIAVLIVDQHVQSALKFADRAYVLKHGEIVLHDSAANLASRPEVLLESYLGDGALEGLSPEPSTAS
jgi:branched-chain amino acid transport system ATP-binding protein